MLVHERGILGNFFESVYAGLTVADGKSTWSLHSTTVRLSHSHLLVAVHGHRLCTVYYSYSLATKGGWDRRGLGLLEVLFTLQSGCVSS